MPLAPKDRVQIANKIEATLRHASDMYQVFLINGHNVLIDYSLRGQCAGMAVKEGDMYTIRINIDAYLLDPENMLNDTIPHEVAHLVMFQLQRHMPAHRKEPAHGPRWQRICKSLGGSGDRCHALPLKPSRKTRKFLYELDSGREVILTSVRHNKLHRRKVAHYMMGDTHEKILPQHFAKEVTA